jgi:Cu/Ag efflux protein CusF
MKNQKSVFTPVARLALAGLLAGSLAMPLTASARIVGAALTTATGQVTAVDPSTRTITLQGANGNTVDVVAGPDVRNFQQIKPGDTLTLDYYESVAVGVRPAGSGAPEVVTETAGTRSPKGAMPAGAAGRQTTITAEIWHINKSANLVTLKGPQGGMRTIQVQDPALQARLQQLKEGDLVDFTITQAVAAAVRK